MPKNVQILLRRGALVFGNSYCTLQAEKVKDKLQKIQKNF